MYLCFTNLFCRENENREQKHSFHTIIFFVSVFVGQCLEFLCLCVSCIILIILQCFFSIAVVVANFIFFLLENIEVFHKVDFYFD